MLEIDTVRNPFFLMDGNSPDGHLQLRTLSADDDIRTSIACQDTITTVADLFNTTLQQVIDPVAGYVSRLITTQQIATINALQKLIDHVTSIADATPPDIEEILVNTRVYYNLTNEAKYHMDRFTSDMVGWIYTTAELTGIDLSQQIIDFVNSKD